MFRTRDEEDDLSSCIWNRLEDDVNVGQTNPKESMMKVDMKPELLKSNKFPPTNVRKVLLRAQ